MILTADQAARVSAALDADKTLAVLVVEGDCSHCGTRVSWHHEMDCSGPTDPPAAWVALEQAAECTALGWCGDGHTPDGCPLCGGSGRLRVELREKCPCTNPIHEREWESDVCEACIEIGCHGGTVPLASATVQVLPVVDRRKLRDHLGRDVVTVNPATGTVALRVVGGQFGPLVNLDIDPPPRPDVDWVVLLDRLRGAQDLPIEEEP